MNLKKILGMALAACVLAACSSDSADSTNESIFQTKAGNTFNDIVKLDKIKEQILVASALTPNEKRILWQDKLANFLANNTLTSAQTSFVINLRAELNDTDLFINGSSKRLAFENNRAPVILSQAQSIFDRPSGSYLLQRVENINHRIDRISNGGGSGTGGIGVEPIEACDCENDDECYRPTGLSIWGVEWEYGDCSSNTCYVSTSFFGWWESDNDGLCEY